MSGFQGTPGPWRATVRHDYREIVGPRKNASWYGENGIWAVAYCDTDLEESEQDANAQLIAAAFDLLTSLQEALTDGGVPGWEDRAQAAIAKALNQ